MGCVGIEPIAATTHIQGNWFTASRVDHNPKFVISSTGGIRTHTAQPLMLVTPASWSTVPYTQGEIRSHTAQFLKLVTPAVGLLGHLVVMVGFEPTLPSFSNS